MESKRYSREQNISTQNSAYRDRSIHHSVDYQSDNI
jgi:hypothetical protein